MRSTPILAAGTVLLSACASLPDAHVGPLENGRHLVATGQIISVPERSIEFAGRPVDLALSSDGDWLFIKDNRGLVVIDVGAWSIRQELSVEGDGGSMTGLAVTPAGDRVYLTTALGKLAEAVRNDAGKWGWSRFIDLPCPLGASSFPCGLTLLPGAEQALVCLSRNNTLGLVDLKSGVLTAEIPVGVAPYDVKLSADGGTAFVSNWGGRPPAPGEPAAMSAGTLALIDDHGVAASGTLSTVDLTALRQTSQLEVGLSPSAVAVLPGVSGTVCVAAANADTLAFVSDGSVTAVSVRPDAGLPFGSLPNGLAYFHDRLYIAEGGTNAIAVLPLKSGTFEPNTPVSGFIPTAWFPGPLIATDKELFVGCIKGIGSRTQPPGQVGWNSLKHRGVVSRIPIPTDAELPAMSEQVRRESGVPRALAAQRPPNPGAPAVAIPVRAGERSVFDHVIYVIKENRTFDQIFGDMGRGNVDPALCTFGREVTPNQHAMADQFALLDNYYCNGVLSAEGHSWATEGAVTPYLERSFGGFKRSYTFGNDPLTYSRTGFIWNHVMATGRSFRNYGEFDLPEVHPKGTYFEVLEDFLAHGSGFSFSHSIGVESVRRQSCPDYPGWNLAIPDVVRASVFLKEFAEFEAAGNLPNFITLYLPDDHTAGAGASVPTPRSMVADNDLALGRIVDAVSHSRFWPTTCIFVIEDDPQDGFDHVDGHRSTCQVISPFTRRGEVVSRFYNQTSVVHTIERIFGVPAPTQFTAIAPLMSECFASRPDFVPFTHVENQVPLGERTESKRAATTDGQSLAELTSRLDFSTPDLADEGILNRVIWHSVKGPSVPYPAELSGAHGKGLAALGLTLGKAGSGVQDLDDDDDDDDDK